MTIAREGFLKNALVKILGEWEIDVEWKKGPNYFKAILPGTAKLCPNDFNVLEGFFEREDRLNRRYLS